MHSFFSSHLLAMIDALRPLFASSCVVDRGHRHTDGTLEMCFWCSEQTLNPHAHAFTPPVDSFVPAVYYPIEQPISNIIEPCVRTDGDGVSACGLFDTVVEKAVAHIEPVLKNIFARARPEVQQRRKNQIDEIESKMQLVPESARSAPEVCAIQVSLTRLIEEQNGFETVLAAEASKAIDELLIALDIEPCSAVGMAVRETVRTRCGMLPDVG